MGNISPQYHVIYDDFFTTVVGLEEQDDLQQAFADIDWLNLLPEGEEFYLYKDDLANKDGRSPRPILDN
jgi:hypothetical protein